MKFDNVSLSMTAKKSAKKCTACSKFCFAYNFCLLYFLVSIIVVVVVAQPRKTILDVRPFRLKTADLMKNARQKRLPQVPITGSKVFL